MQYPEIFSRLVGYTNNPDIERHISVRVMFPTSLSGKDELSGMEYFIIYSGQNFFEGERG